MKDEWNKRFEEGREKEIKGIPEGYFSSLEERVMDRWSARQEPVVRRLGLWRWMVPVAAALGLLFWYSGGGEALVKDQVFELLTDEEMAYYYLHTEEISPTELWMEVDDLPVDTIEEWLLTDVTFEGSELNEMF